MHLTLKLSKQQEIGGTSVGLTVVKLFSVQHKRSLLAGPPQCGVLGVAKVVIHACLSVAREYLRNGSTVTSFWVFQVAFFESDKLP